MNYLVQQVRTFIEESKDFLRFIEEQERFQRRSFTRHMTNNKLINDVALLFAGVIVLYLVLGLEDQYISGAPSFNAELLHSLLLL